MSEARPARRTYDVCLSFAAANRPYVDQVASELKTLGVTCFYDHDENIVVELWGKDLFQYLDTVYRADALCCVVFISAAYANARWPSHELRSAQAGAFAQVQEYILAARFDDTEIPGIRPTDGYIDLRSRNPRQLAQLIARKIEQLQHDAPDRPDALRKSQEGEAPPPPPTRKAATGVRRKLIVAISALAAGVGIVWAILAKVVDSPPDPGVASTITSSPSASVAVVPPDRPVVLAEHDTQFRVVSIWWLRAVPVTDGQCTFQLLDPQGNSRYVDGPEVILHYRTGGVFTIKNRRNCTIVAENGDGDVRQLPIRDFRSSQSGDTFLFAAQSDFVVSSEGHEKCNSILFDAGTGARADDSRATPGRPLVHTSSGTFG